MERQFNLTLTNRWKATGFVLATIIVFFVLVLLAAWVLAHYLILGFVGMALALGGLIFMQEYVGRRVAFETAVATIDETGLTVCHNATGAVRHIRFADMASYSTDDDFIVRPHVGDRLVLHHNFKMHPQGMEAKWAFRQHFQWAVADYQQRHPDQPPIRNLGFFSRPAATFWLAVFAAFVSWLGWRAWQPFAGEGAWGGFLLAGLLFVIYALTWLHYRKQLRQ